MTQPFASPTARTGLSVALILAALGLAYVPLPSGDRTLYTVIGSELQEPLAALEARFEAANPNIAVEIKVQGSQDLVNNFINADNDFTPTILIPANGEKLDELAARLATEGVNEPFYHPPQPIAKTMLVGIAWPERGAVLFPDGRFDWSSLEAAMQSRTWAGVGGQPDWGSFDFIMTDPTRSNSGQLTLSLWAESKTGALTPTSLNDPDVLAVVELTKRSVYQPPRSTDILLQEFIARGPNDADVATVYESIALHRWSQAQTTQGKPYQIYYLEPTIETVATAAIARRAVDASTAKAAQAFIDFLRAPEQQAVFVQYGFRPVAGDIELEAVANSPGPQGFPARR